MLTEIIAPDVYGKGRDIANVTPTQVLCDILPELAEREVCPYRGLEPFTAEHARWFEGRKRCRAAGGGEHGPAPPTDPIARTIRVGQVHVWNANSGTPEATMIGRSAWGWVISAAYSPDGHTLATAGLAYVVRLWTADLPKPTAAIKKVCSLVNRDLTPQEGAAYLSGHTVKHVCSTELSK
ncbi:WD40 repeat domain-containing protein [Streptomyces chartreusis]